MITTSLLYLLYLTVAGLIMMLTTPFGVVSLPVESMLVNVIDSLDFLFGMLMNWNWLIPLDQVFFAFSVVIILELFFFSTSVVFWIIRFIRGQ